MNDIDLICMYILELWFLVLMLDINLQERRRLAVLQEQQRRRQQAMASKPSPSEDNFEMKAMKAMGAMEEGDAVFGSGSEVNLDSEVLYFYFL